MEKATDITSEQEVKTDRRAFERTPVTLIGRCLLENGMEIPCQAVDISAGDVGLVAGHSPEIGEMVILYLDHIGRLQGDVARVHEAGFALRLHISARGREKLVARIEWLKGHEHFGNEDLRRNQRVEPRNQNSHIRLSDGRSYPAKIIDISLSGAAISSDVRPAIGSKVYLSGMQGVVVRHFTEGIAIEFEKPLEQPLRS